MMRLKGVYRHYLVNEKNYFTLSAAHGKHWNLLDETPTEEFFNPFIHYGWDFEPALFGIEREFRLPIDFLLGVGDET